MTTTPNKTEYRFLPPEGRYLLDYALDSCNDQLREGAENPEVTLPSLFVRAKMLVNKTGLFFVKKQQIKE